MSREAFEAWWKEVNKWSTYQYLHKEAAYEIWQASRKAALLDAADKFANRDGFLACAMQLRRMAEGE